MSKRYVKGDLIQPLASAIANLAEKIEDDPEMVLDDMKFSEDTFTH